MNFKKFQSLTNYDIARFEDSFFHMLDVNGAIVSDTIGFTFNLDDEEFPNEGGTAKTIDIIETFSPIAIFVGTKELQEELSKLGYQSLIMSWFEGGGYAVVLKTPVPRVR